MLTVEDCHLVTVPTLPFKVREVLLVPEQTVPCPEIVPALGVAVITALPVAIFDETAPVELTTMLPEAPLVAVEAKRTNIVLIDTEPVTGVKLTLEVKVPPDVVETW